MMGGMTDRVERTRQLPNGRLIVEAGWVLAGFGRHRDSTDDEVGRFEAGYLALAGDVPEDLGRPWAGDVVDGPVAVAHFQHWGVGWIDELVIRADRPDLIAIADDLIDRLDDRG